MRRPGTSDAIHAFNARLVLSSVILRSVGGDRNDAALSSAMRRSRLLSALIGLMSILVPLGLLLYALLPTPAGLLVQVGVTFAGIVAGAYLLARLTATASQEDRRA